ncbi:hypothetical protein [Massilia antarctica]|uniref:hypothetical protein n=1 Tax=Massilia antarctica TaxID=2765360 RepID=UPI0022717ED1|nr:hypothetical protein [Massilia sp. H27-R4]MCY0913235.1 hypothetical protein [Massilia sp. H27-R4]
MNNGNAALAFGVISMIFSLSYVLAPTTAPAPISEPTPPTPTSNLRYEPLVFLDQITGCQYLSTHTSATLVPRMAADGKTHMGCNGVAP